MSASIIAIGDELLSGFTLDTNTHWIAQRLRALGHPVKRATQVRDRQEEIVEQVRRDLADAEVKRKEAMEGMTKLDADREAVRIHRIERLNNARLHTLTRGIFLLFIGLVGMVRFREAITRRSVA